MSVCGHRFLQLPRDLQRRVLLQLNIKERVRFICSSKSLLAAQDQLLDTDCHSLLLVAPRQPGWQAATPALHLQRGWQAPTPTLHPQQLASYARWLSKRRSKPKEIHIHGLEFVPREAAQRAAAAFRRSVAHAEDPNTVLQQLAAQAPLTMLSCTVPDWTHMVAVDLGGEGLQLPHLRELHISVSTRYAEDFVVHRLELPRNFSRLTALTQLKLLSWGVHFARGCLPASLQVLHLHHGRSEQEWFPPFFHDVLTGSCGQGLRLRELSIRDSSWRGGRGSGSAAITSRGLEQQTSLTSLSLAGLYLPAGFPRELSALTGLRHLSLDRMQHPDFSEIVNPFEDDGGWGGGDSDDDWDEGNPAGQQQEEGWSLEELSQGLLSLTSLTHIHLGGFMYNARLPPEFWLLPSLKVVDLHDMCYTGLASIPAVPPGATQLEQLQVDLDFAVEHMEALSSMAGLRVLGISFGMDFSPSTRFSPHDGSMRSDVSEVLAMGGRLPALRVLRLHSQGVAALNMLPAEAVQSMLARLHVERVVAEDAWTLLHATL